MSEDENCNHINIDTDKGTTVCIDCGEELCQASSSKKDIDESTRVQARKVDSSGIYKDVENLGFSEIVINKANKIYTQVTSGQIHRGKARKAIVFACVYHSLKCYKNPLSHERLIEIFEISRKDGIKGLKHVNLKAPRDSEIRTTYITPINLVDEIMDQFNATNSQKQEVKKIYEQIHNKSSKLNRSRPKSVTSSLVYYWICKRKMDISLKDFTKKVGLSELTITKLAKEIAQ